VQIATLEGALRLRTASRREEARLHQDGGERFGPGGSQAVAGDVDAGERRVAESAADFLDARHPIRLHVAAPSGQGADEGACILARDPKPREVQLLGAGGDQILSQLRLQERRPLEVGAAAQVLIDDGLLLRHPVVVPFPPRLQGVSDQRGRHRRFDSTYFLNEYPTHLLGHMCRRFRVIYTLT
jgi:hypothetical protein